MDKIKVKKRIEKLREEIEYHRHLYHVLDKQEISDAALDSLKHELFQLEQKFPEFTTSDSPTQRVGGEPLKEFREVHREIPMLSLEDVFSFEELEDWEKRNRKISPNGKYSYYCELKIDGLAIEIKYREGILVEASTRGDGRTGEDVTQNVRTIDSVPLRLPKTAPQEITVRGEVYMEQKQFDELNKIQESFGKPTYANPRNVAAGSIRQLDPKIAASRKLMCVAYDIVDDQGFEWHHDEHRFLSEMGFRTSEFTEECADLKAVERYQQKWQEKRSKLPHWIDGVVVFIDHNNTFKGLGSVGKTPRGGVAFKFAAEEATTVVENILVQVGRTGALTPVAVLRPVNIAGTTVSRATLHNEDEVIRKDVRIGDTVVIHKAGDIIPEIVRVLPKMRPEKAVKFKMPNNCPICGYPVERDKKGAIARCTNKECSAQQLEGLIHFVSRSAADIEGVGPKLIEKLVEVGLVRDPADFYALKKEDILSLERFAEKSADNVIESIQGHKKFSLGRFLYALGIKHVGVVTANALAERFAKLEAFSSLGKEQLSNVEGVGEIVGQSVFEYFQNKKTQALLNKFNKFGVEILKEKKTEKGILNNETIVVTGSVGEMSRDEVWDLVRKNSGKVSDSVSKSTTMLVAGKEPGSKLKKASQMNIKILSADEFLDLVKAKKNS